MAAVIDWELCSLGHPLTDLAHFCVGYYLPANDARFSIPGVFEWSLCSAVKEGLIPSVQQVCQWYQAERTGHLELSSEISIPGWRGFIALEMLKILMIFQGIAMRQRMGQASSKHAKHFESLIQPLNELLMQFLKSPSAML